MGLNIDGTSVTRLHLQVQPIVQRIESDRIEGDEPVFMRIRRSSSHPSLTLWGGNGSGVDHSKKGSHKTLSSID